MKVVGRRERYLMVLRIFFFIIALFPTLSPLQNNGMEKVL